MDGAARAAKIHGRIRPGVLANQPGDPNAVIDTCPGCARYMTLDHHGMCGTEECHEGMLAKGRRKGIVHRYGDYVYLPTKTIAVLETPHPTPETEAKLERIAAREYTGDLPICAQSECTSVPRTDDTFCIVHRMEANALRHKVEKAKRAARASTSDSYTELPSRRRARENWQDKRSRFQRRRRSK